LNSKPILILGIDPGYERLGVALIEKTKNGDMLLFSDCIQTDKKLSHSERLAKIGKSLEETYELYKPTEVCTEKLFFSNNQKTALLVAEARGVILYTAARIGLHVFEYGPAEIKIAVTGHGRSDKKQITAMVSKLVRITKEIKHDDEYDAIAIALTHSASRGFLGR